MVWIRKTWMVVIASICCSVAANAQHAVRIDLAKPYTNTPKTLSLLAPDAATCNYGFFCRQELKGDKALPMPVRLRLGSMQQTEWLEQKPNTIAPTR